MQVQTFKLSERFARLVIAKAFHPSLSTIVDNCGGYVVRICIAQNLVNQVILGMFDSVSKGKTFERPSGRDVTDNRSLNLDQRGCVF